MKRDGGHSGRPCTLSKHYISVKWSTRDQRNQVISQYVIIIWTLQVHIILLPRQFMLCCVYQSRRNNDDGTALYCTVAQTKRRLLRWTKVKWHIINSISVSLSYLLLGLQILTKGRRWGWGSGGGGKEWEEDEEIYEEELDVRTGAADEIL